LALKAKLEIVALNYMQVGYEHLFEGKAFGTSQEIYHFFWNEVSSLWVEAYTNTFRRHGEIFQQTFEGYAFLVDVIWPYEAEDDINNELPESRVISFFGISNTNIKKSNRRRMARGWGKTSSAFAPYGTEYDKGHFIAHSCGAPVDMNIFPQRRDINRGWSDEGKIFRSMERYIASNPGTFVFSRPIYNDLTVCPQQLEYGYFDKDFKLKIGVFQNR
jgi:hypothetical protein